MFLLLLKNFLYSRMVVTALLLILLAGFISMYTGKIHVQKQANAVEKTIRSQQEHIRRNVQFFDKEMGLLLYYLKFAYINKAPALNGLSIGQRDVNSSIQHVNIRNLENQKYDTDLFNPSSLLAGNLDFSFVLIFLLPLLIIAITYGLLSEEKEGGTWKLVFVQSANAVKLLMQKVYIRALVTYAVLALLLALASIILSLPLDVAFAVACGICFLYVAFWFALCFWVVSWQKSSSINAVSLLTIWVLLTVVLPGALNSYIINKYPVPEAMATAVAQREGVHEKWDMDKRATMNKFYAHYPQFSKFPIPATSFSWLWYYAMQQMGDDDARKESTEMKAKLTLRNEISNRISLFVPTLHTQLHLNKLGQSGLENHLQFLDSTEKFHERMRMHFYPKIFSEVPVKSEDWSRFKGEYFTERVRINWLSMFLPLVLITATLVVFCIFNLYRKVSP